MCFFLFIGLNSKSNRVQGLVQIFRLVSLNVLLTMAKATDLIVYNPTDPNLACKAVTSLRLASPIHLESRFAR